MVNDFDTLTHFNASQLDSRPMWACISIVLSILALVNASITGQNLCNFDICVTALRNNATLKDTYTVTPATNIPKTSFGWIAVGFGDQMADSPMIILWPNTDGTFTLSQRQASSEVMPTVVSKPARVATLNTTASFSNATTTSFTFTLPVTDVNTNATDLIWAYSLTNPKSASVSATIVEHLWSGTETIYLLADYVTGSAISSSSGSSESGGISDALFAHIACGALGTLLVIPTGVIVPRIVRGMTTSRWWFYFHAINQAVVGFALVIATFSIGIGFGGGIDSRHRKTGVALFVLMIIQSALGVFVHWYRPGTRISRYTFETQSGRGPSNFLHLFLGIVIVCVGWSATWTGMSSEWPLRGYGTVNVGYKVGWGFAVVIWIGLWIIGVYIYLPRQRRLESQARALKNQNTNGFAVGTDGDFNLPERNTQLLPTQTITPTWTFARSTAPPPVHLPPIRGPPPIPPRPLIQNPFADSERIAFD